MEQSSSVNIKFEGQRLKEGVIDIYDLASTILAFGQSVEAIAKNQGYTKNNKVFIEVSALKPGSFDVHLLINFSTIMDAAGMAMTMVVSTNVNIAKLVTDILQEIIRVKKFLGGKEPKQVKVEQTGDKPTAIIYNFNGDNMNVSMPVFNNLQDKSLNTSIQHMYKPLTKEDGNVEMINITTEKNLETSEPDEIGVNKDEAQYFEDTSELQRAKGHQIKATVTRLDSKTATGFLTLKGGRRVTFETGGIDPNKFDEAFLILAESLKLRIPIYITGEAIFDLESNLKKIFITEIKTETKLF